MLVLLTLGKARCWTLLLVLPPSLMIPVPDLVVLLSLCKELYSEPMDSLQEQVRICRIPSEIKNLQTVTSEHETEAGSLSTGSWAIAKVALSKMRAGHL